MSPAALVAARDECVAPAARKAKLAIAAVLAELVSEFARDQRIDAHPVRKLSAPVWPNADLAAGGSERDGARKTAPASDEAARMMEHSIYAWQKKQYLQENCTVLL